jgi:phosphoglucomutase
MNGTKEIADMMQGYRNDPPKQINGCDVVKLLDYEQQISKNLTTGESQKLNLPGSNVLQFILSDGTKISARPSGTEPKIKFYFSVNTKLNSIDEFEETEKKLDDKIASTITDMGLNK